MAEARRLIAERAPHLEVDGEMHGDAALSEAVRKAAFPGTTLHGEANLLIMPNVEAANITYNLLKMVSGEGVTVGPFLLGDRQAGAYPDAGRDGQADHQHDGGGVGGSAGGEGDVNAADCFGIPMTC